MRRSDRNSDTVYEKILAISYDTANDNKHFDFCFEHKPFFDMEVPT